MTTATQEQTNEGKPNLAVETELDFETGLPKTTTGEEETNEEGGEKKTANGEDETVIAIEGETTEEDEINKAPEWVRELRKTNRELAKRNRELEEKANANQQTTQTAVVVGAKPKLEDFNYDTDKFETELEAWHERKRQADEETRKKQAETTAAQEAWQQTLNGYNEAKKTLKVKDFEDAEDAAKTVLSVTQQGIILQGAKNSAILIYALGKNPKKAKELASIKDPVKFAFTIANLENQLKVTNRKAATPPEKTITGSGSISGTVDSTLEKLREEAERTGDMTKVIAYKRQLKQKA